MASHPYEPSAPFTQSQLTRIERAIGRNLPADYREFAARFGGALVAGLVRGSLSLPVLGFFEAEETLADRGEFPELRAMGALPIADCSLGNIYVLLADNSVVYINYYNRPTVVVDVSGSFAAFLADIVPEPEGDT